MRAELARSITRGMMAIEAMQPAIGPDGFSGPEREAIEMLTWMSWQPVEQFPDAVREAFPALAARGLVELCRLRPDLPVSRARLAVAKAEAGRTGEGA